MNLLEKRQFMKLFEVTKTNLHLRTGVMKVEMYALKYYIRAISDSKILRKILQITPI